MGTWSAEIFGNDVSCETEEEFFLRYNRGERPSEIKNDLLLDEEDEDRFNVLFSLAHCLWEVGQLDEAFLLEVKAIIQSDLDIALTEELGADDEFLAQRRRYLAEFLEKISVQKARPKKRVAPPMPVESKYTNGAVMVFQYTDGLWGALIVINGVFFDKETHYTYLQTTVKTKDKPTMEVVRQSHIIDINFHNAERNQLPYRSPQFYDSFDYCISQYLKSRETKNFESYNDSFFEVIGYLSDWGGCSSGIYAAFDYNQKTVEDFQAFVRTLLTALYNKPSAVHTEMTVDEIDQAFFMKSSQ